MTIKEIKKLPSLILLNSEGDILTAYKQIDMFYILDMYKKQIALLTQEEIVAFTVGEKILTNSVDEKFDFPTFSEGMRPKFDKLNEFIYGK